MGVTHLTPIYCLGELTAPVRSLSCVMFGTYCHANIFNTKHEIFHSCFKLISLDVPDLQNKHFYLYLMNPLCILI